MILYTTAYYPELSMIPSRYTRPLYPGIGTITSTKTTLSAAILNDIKYKKHKIIKLLFC